MDNHQQDHSLKATVSNPVVGLREVKSKVEGTNFPPEHVAPKGYLSFVEARKFAVSLQLKTRKDWRQYIKGELVGVAQKPENIPAHPDGIYKVKGWQGWKFWLGTIGGLEG